MQLRLAQLIPPGFLWPKYLIFSDQFQDVVDQYTERADIRYKYSYRGEICTTTIKGFGFGYDCSSSSIAFKTANQTFQSESNKLESVEVAVPVFNVSTQLAGSQDVSLLLHSPLNASEKLARSIDRIKISSLFKTKPECGGDLSLTTCTLTPALIEYRVVLRNGTIELQYPHWQHDTFLYNTTPWNNLTTSGPFDKEPIWVPLSNWVNFFQSQFNVELDMYLSDLAGGPGPAEGTTGLYTVARKHVAGGTADAINSLNCSTTFRDPTQHVLDRMREIAFRTAVAAASVTDMTVLFGNSSLVDSSLPLIQNWTQTVEYSARETRTVYSISYPHLFCAVAVSLLGVVAVIPLYDGWWELGRPISFNPLEIAKAFDAPILERVDGNAVKERIVEQSGLERVRYGVVDGDGGGRLRLKMFEERLVRRPEYGETFLG
ncbi:hypothetical protein W97_06210 [Coniosporium apollinis CBS 100218]|uniref:Uncharacterized protein n=1 Tax=Coniosporium apollinis (strain CBS 100218) TaxID=1168221 RepID=R7YY72_CONA1|nr:uncharacterized protein W97_06210 [Coniosporium apollinis CBS 100218]EON66808.1 hypothetical protein W97_06210 [Coniosporium apollinis CBS 100218]